MARVTAVTVITVVGSWEICERVVGSSSFWVTIFFSIPISEPSSWRWVFPVFLSMPVVCAHMTGISVVFVYAATWPNR